MGLPGVAEMDVHIAYPRYHRQPGAVYDLRFRRGNAAADFTDLAVADKDIHVALKAVRAVHNMTVFQ